MPFFRETLVEAAQKLDGIVFDERQGHVWTLFFYVNAERGEDKKALP